MSRKLYYFDLKGYAEGIRYLLHYGGLEFEDVRFSREEYPKVKETLQPPFGKVPVYVEGDRTLHQSQVIGRYIARQLDLVPTDPWEEAKADSVLNTMGDFTTELRGFILEQDPEKKEERKKKLLDETFDYYYSRFEKQLAENNGYFSKTFSWVDIVFVAMLSTIQDFIEIKLDSYTNINALIAKVQSSPGIKEYLEKSTPAEKV